jgi:tRNA G18 (ribose-2'-O)-methylase SpoU
MIADDTALTQTTTHCRSAPEMHLVITNISKRANIRALLQTAAAFGCASVLVVGQKTFDLESTGNDLPEHLKQSVAAGTLQIKRFGKWADCVAYLIKSEILLVGVEIHKEAKPIEHFLRHDMQDIAFLVGNEGTGLHDKQLQSCDAFVRIPQYGGGTASLNVYVAASIILFAFHNHQRRLRRPCQEKI